jgi:hypothetical protein
MRASIRWISSILIIVIVIVVLYGVTMIRDGFSTRDRPSTAEAFVAEATRSWSIPVKAKRMTNPVLPSPGVYAGARAHFADHCAQCHANDGSGDTPMGRNLYPKPPDMRLPLTQNKTDGELYHVIQYGIRLSGMPAFGNPVDDDQDTWKLVVFIRDLPHLSDQEEREMEHLNPKSPDELQEELEEQQFLNGNKFAPSTTTK